MRGGRSASPFMQTKSGNLGKTQSHAVRFGWLVCWLVEWFVGAVLRPQRNPSIDSIWGNYTVVDGSWTGMVGWLA